MWGAGGMTALFVGGTLSNLRHVYTTHELIVILIGICVTLADKPGCSLPSPPLPYPRDELDRKLQAEFTGDVLARAVNPIVMISYITNKPHGRDYKRIVEHGKVKVRPHWAVCV